MSVALLTLLLHEGGWDEALMVGAGLVLAYLIIIKTGRKDDEGDAAEDESTEDEAASRERALSDERTEPRR